MNLVTLQTNIFDRVQHHRDKKVTELVSCSAFDSEADRPRFDALKNKQ